MTRRTLSPLVAILALSLGLVTTARAQDQARPEPWADPGLKVTRGLALWLDAGRLNSARKAHALAEIVEGERVDLWHDASGRGRHVAQKDEAARPRLLQGAVRFDGEATFLERAGLDAKVNDFTLFLVAAPLSNAGSFPAFLALHRNGEADFTSALNVDLGAGYTGRFDVLNVEGRGFGGMLNLLARPSPFGEVRRMTLSSSSGPGNTWVRMDGGGARARDRQAATLDADRLLVGARHYGFPPRVGGFLDGDILQVLLYDRVLDESERLEVEGYLADRLKTQGPALRPLRAAVGKPLVAVPNPPAVQMLVPGFSTREIPVDLTNINNVRYRGDGKLVALAYDGNIHLLSDRDGDGLEETSSVFFENKGSLVGPIGMALTKPGDPRGDGVFVASKGRITLVLDEDRDGKADKEIVVASGWKELPVAVDALGVAIDAEGNIFFGLGTTDFTNAYVLDKQGKSAYRVQDDHGSIQKVSPDFTKREIVASGIRFPVGLAFNREGDLFATDQEGATWLPNGNPFDELLHIRQGRHYGFPPRHPMHLPSVRDEPSVFDYAPQHQSTCGLTFNEPVNGGPAFGPDLWAGDAIVTGYSRGKLFLTKLAKSPGGYVARNRLIAVLNMLPSDTCVSPKGDLVVAVHSGQPDWGSGPKGKGKLYKIAYTDREVPQPVLAYASSPQEVRVAYDRPIDPSSLRDLATRASIEYGRFVQPADRFESLRPGYEVVGRQMATPRFSLSILSAAVSADRRTLLLTTSPMPEAASYAITLPGPYGSEIDLGFDLSGVQAEWRDESGSVKWTGWLPHANLGAARAFTAKSAEHDRLWGLISTPGRLTIRTKLDLWHMLRPAVQPGSTLGYRLPDEEVTIAVSGSAPVEVKMSPGSHPLTPSKSVQITTKPEEGRPQPLEIAVATGPATDLDLTWTTGEDDRPRALPVRRFLLPWASLERRTDDLAARDIPELKGGDWARGRAVFYGETAKCSTCHKVRGRGGEIGPDLSNLVHRDYASVYRDVHTPSAAINPDYITHTVALTDGRTLQGTLLAQGGYLVVSDSTGARTTVKRDEVEATSPATTSIMPEGIDTALGPEGMRDLLTFLLSDPLAPAKHEIEGAPPARPRAELDAVLKGSVPVENPRKLRVVLASGPKDHGPGEHDYPLWSKRWSALLATDPTLEVETSAGWPSAEQFATAHVIVMYSNNPGWDASKGPELDAYFARGGGLVVIHFAVDGHDAVKPYADRIGLASGGGRTAFRHGPLDLDFTGTTHPIARGFTKLKLIDESYWKLTGDPASVALLATSKEEGTPTPQIWTHEPGKGRVFVSIPGHYTWTFDDPLFRVLLLRGMAWSANEPIDRFNELVPLGARIAD